MIIIDNTKGAQLFTTIIIFFDDEPFKVFRTLGEIKKSEMPVFMQEFFEDCFTNHLGETELVLGHGRILDLNNGFTVTTDVDWIDGGFVGCNSIFNIDKTLKRISEF